ncbi:hypothetical protein FB45DRAFT_1067467 [Roridomyces roridus]|uniref:F-box domain-containing protein n=1 Tax=Roridomyces roridus TaxID=1738132 RepID=A0AAD7B2R3_9AGAR|nr:hypothetical protein FB45DRAFT_1067467 [Roridomyces roridus]
MPIPQELIDLILSNLAGDALSLKSCSLTTRTFVRPSQVLLFKRVTILPPMPNRTGDNPCQRFYKRITSSPHLASYVQELRVVLAVRPKGSEATEPGLSWIISGRTLSLVLPLLNLTHISLADTSFPGRATGGLNWSQLGRSLRSALSAVFSSPILQSVDLQGVYISSPRELLSLFCDACSLKSLNLTRVWFDPTHKDDSWPLSRTWRPKLTSVFFFETFGDPFCSHFRNPQIDLSGLTKLMILASSMDGWIFGPDVTPVLGDLMIYLDPLPSFNSFVTPNLRSLRVFTSNWSEGLLQFFTVCPRNAHIEIFSLDGPSTPCTVDLTVLNDAVESLLPHLPSLKKVQLRVLQTRDVDHQAVLDWAETIRASLKSLASRGLLSITDILGIRNMQ